MLGNAFYLFLMLSVSLWIEKQEDTEKNGYTRDKEALQEFSMNSWKNEKSTKLQRKKITELMESLENYRLNLELEKITKGQAHYLIDSLVSRKLDKLIEKKVLIPNQNKKVEESSKDFGKPIKYNVSDGEDLWTYTNFRTAVNGKLLDYKTEGKIILYQIIEVENEISPDIIKSHDLIIKKIED